MSCYTLTKDLLNNIENKKHFADLLFAFTQDNPLKVAVDRTKKIIDIYHQVASSKKHIATWLDLLSYEPSSLEVINVNILDDMPEEDIFLKVCSMTANIKIIIVYSHQNWVAKKYTGQNVIVYEDVPVRVLDRDEALVEIPTLFSGSTNIIAYGSQIATDGSAIHDSKNTK